MTRLSLAHRHDPYWDLEGRGARRSRHQRQLVTWAMRLIAVLSFTALVTHLPMVDASVLTAPEAKPILAVALFSLLASFALLALARIRSADPS